MHSPDRGPMRAARTAFLAVACTALAWYGHAIWGGSPPAPGSFLVATALMGLLLARFTRHQRGFGEIFAVLGTAQVGLHLVFLSGAQHSAPAPGAVSAVHGAHAAHVMAGYSPGMLAGHLWAALLASALLAHGETALWTLLALLGRAVPASLRPGTPVPAGAVALRSAPEPPPVHPGLRVLRRHPPRGPPGRPSHRRCPGEHARPERTAHSD